MTTVVVVWFMGERSRGGPWREEEILEMAPKESVCFAGLVNMVPVPPTPLKDDDDRLSSLPWTVSYFVA